MWIDRFQLLVADRAEVAARWRRLVDAEVAREDEVRPLGALRTVLAVGTSEVELLEPLGTGPVADFARERRGQGVFAAGFAVEDVARVRDELERDGAPFVEDGAQLLLPPEATGNTGLRLVVSPRTERSRTGLIEHIYEVTNLVEDPRAACDALADCFGLDRAHFVSIRSEAYGYDGQLTLFDPQRLDRIEIIHPFAAEKTMGRFFGRFGACLYMCYAETDRSGEVRERALEHAPNDWTGPRDGDRPDNLFLHPRALGGAMMGVSRTHFAWSWSGSPERVTP